MKPFDAASTRGPGIFVGREREVAELHAALAEADAGRGGVVMLAGEPGIGKSRTAQELAGYAEQAGVEVLWGRCYESGGAPSYWPWLQALRRHVEAHQPDELARQMGARASVISEVLPELREKLPGLAAPEPIQDHDAARFRLFDSIAAFLREATRGQTLLLILENLHAADKPSLLLLEFLAHEVRDLQLLVLGTYRDIELTRAHPLSETLAELAREIGTQGFATLRLRGLEQVDVSAFLDSVSGSRAPEELARLVHAQTEGNPLFVVEVARLFLEEGIAGPTAGTSSDAMPRTLKIPEGVKQVIGRRINRLSPSCVEVLTTASVIGRDFAYAELQRLRGAEPADAVLEALEEALAARVVEEVAGATGLYQFSHVLIRETLYDELSAPRRAILHRQVGDAIEALYHDHLDDHVARLAYHFAEAAGAVDPDKGADYALRAAERATRLLAYERAADHYRTALSALATSQTADLLRRCRLLLALGDVEAKGGDYPSARETFMHAASLARDLGSSDDYARAALGFEYASWQPGLNGAPAAELLREALERTPTDATALRARLLGTLGRALTFSGSVEEGVRVTRESLTMARATGDWRTLAQILQGRTESFFTPSMTRELQALGAEVLALAAKEGADEIAMNTLAWSPSCHFQLGDLAAARAQTDALDALARRHQQPFFLYNAACARITLALAEGRFGDAEEEIHKALVTAERFKGIDPVGIYGLQMFTLRRAQGRLAEIEPTLRAFVRQRDGDATWRPGLAVIYAELDLRDEAREQFELLAPNGFERLPRDALWGLCITYLSTVCAYLGDEQRAGDLYRLLQPFDGYYMLVGGGIAFSGAAARYLGMLARTTGDWPTAEQHFEDALALDQRAGAPVDLAHTRCEYAVGLLTVGGAQNEQRAWGLLGSALDTATTLGMASLAARCRELLGRPGSAHRASGRAPAPAYPDELTEREMEVLRLLAVGKTNQEIAAALIISPNTAAHHVASIIAKIGAPNRTAAAAYALSRGLVPPTE